MTSGQPTSRRHAAVGAVLVAALAETRDIRHDGARLESVDLEVLTEAASRHRVSAHLYTMARDVMPPGSSELAPLKAAYTGAAMTHLRCSAELSHLASVLNPRAISWVVVKGPAVASLYPDPALRTYGDLDVLVSRREFRTAVDLLESAGYALLDRNWVRITEARAGELHLRTPYGGILDLHWALSFHETTRDYFRIDTDAILSRAIPMRGNGPTVLTADPEDTLIHLCVHACASGGDRLIWLKDIERAIARGVDWGEVIRRSAQWRCANAVALMVSRAHRVLGAPVPPATMQALCPSWSWRTLTAGVDAVFPPERSSREASPTRIVAHAVRADTAASWRELASRLWHIPGDIARRRLPGRGSADLMDDRGGQAERESYLSYVSGEDAGPLT